eukprot:gene12735-14944_t
MPLTVKGPRKASTRHLITLLSGALPILLGVLILYWQAGRTLEHSTAQTAQEAVRQFDLMLDNTALAAQDLLPLAGHECDNPTQLKLREQVTRRPFVRATTLSWQRNIYCSSLFGGNYQSPVNPEDYVGGRLWLMKGNPVTPDTALLVYRLTEGDRGAFASIDGYHLTNALRLISRYTDLVLQVGPNWLAADGKVHSTALPTFSVAHHHLDSTRYTYSVEAGMPEGETWRYMRARYPALFVLVVFFGVLAGILAHWLQKRSSTAAQLAPHTAQFADNFHVGINITARHCHDLELVEDCREFLAAFPPGKVILVLELTERELIEPTDITRQLFQALFVAMIGVDALSRHILDSIIELSAKLDLGIVAEGVETQEQCDYLAAQGVDFLQGYLFGKPVPCDEFIRFLNSH